MAGAVRAGVRPPGLMVEPDCVVVRAGVTEADLLLELTPTLQHDVARETVAARLVSAVAGEI